MINWIKNKFQQNKLTREPMEMSLKKYSPDVGRLNGMIGLNFKVYKAQGGTIIECSKYDHKNDRSLNNLYIITDDKDIGVEMGKIITMENLR